MVRDDTDLALTSVRSEAHTIALGWVAKPYCRLVRLIAGIQSFVPTIAEFVFMEAFVLHAPIIGVFGIWRRCCCRLSKVEVLVALRWRLRSQDSGKATGAFARVTR